MQIFEIFTVSIFVLIEVLLSFLSQGEKNRINPSTVHLLTFYHITL